TNTYLIGKRPPWVLIDVGEGKAEYTQVLEEAIRQELRDVERPWGILVSDIIITHRHGDHHGGLPSVLSLLRDLCDSPSSYTPPRLHKFPLAEGGSMHRFIRKSTLMMDTSLQDMEKVLDTARDLYVQAESGKQAPYFHDLHDRQVFTMRDGTTLEIIHTPGHTSDSVSLILQEEQAMFTGDMVLGHGTAVFEDLSQYMTSLTLMRDTLRSLDDSDAKRRIYPGHGAVVEDGCDRIDEYIKHRQEREDEIVEVLRVHSADGGGTIGVMVEKIYASAPRSVWPAAAFGVAQHLLKLEGEGRVAKEDVANDVDPQNIRWWLV
ncbi:hypothetical protein FRB99_002967, partial [Tulasnella sp. 403]